MGNLLTKSNDELRRRRRNKKDRRRSKKQKSQAAASAAGCLWNKKNRNEENGYEESMMNISDETDIASEADLALGADDGSPHIFDMMGIVSIPIDDMIDAENAKDAPEKKDDEVKHSWEVKRRRKKSKKNEGLTNKPNIKPLIDALSTPPTVPLDLVPANSPSSVPFNPLGLDTQEDAGVDFESFNPGSLTNEISRPEEVSCITMSRERHASDLKPLMIAIGETNGAVIVSSISDATSDNGDEVSSQKSVQLEGRVRALDFSPSGEYLIGAGDDCSMSLIKVTYTGEGEDSKIDSLDTVQKIERVDRVCALQFSSDGDIIAVGGYDGKVALYRFQNLLTTDAPSLQPIAEIQRPGLVLTLSFSNDGRFIAVGGSDRCCAVYDTTTWSEAHEVKRESIQCCQFSPDSKYLAIGGRDVAILKIPSAGNRSSTQKFKIICEIRNTSTPAESEDKYSATAVTWSPTGSFLAIGGSDRCCLVVETKGYALVHEVRRDKGIECMAWGTQYMKPYQECFLGISDGTCNVSIVQAGSENTFQPFDQDDDAVSTASSFLSSDSEWTLSEGSFLDMEDQLDMPKKSEDKGGITSIAFSKKSMEYLAYVREASLSIRMTESWEEIFQTDFEKNIVALAFANKENYLAIGCGDVLFVYDFPRRSMVCRCPLNAGCITALSFSNGDERLAVGTQTGVIVLLEPTGWNLECEIDYDDSAVMSICWSANYFAAGRESGQIAIFENEQLFEQFSVPHAEFRSNGQHVRSLSFGPDGRQLAVGYSRSIAVHNCANGWPMVQRAGLSTDLRTMLWSGQNLIIAADEKVCRIIGTTTWTDVEEADGPILEMIENSEEISCLSSSSDGRSIAFGFTDANIKILQNADSGKWALLPLLFHANQIIEEHDRDASMDHTADVKDHTENDKINDAAAPDQQMT